MGKTDLDEKFPMFGGKWHNDDWSFGKGRQTMIFTADHGWNGGLDAIPLFIQNNFLI